jgi:Tol biopolymer transport system component
MFWSLREATLAAPFADIFVATRDNANDRWSAPVNVGAPISRPESNEITPNLLPDGQTLLFSSNRAGGLGSMDIWMSTRLPGCR